jgi:ATP-binding protein involved in chromosome partitioning
MAWVGFPADKFTWTGPGGEPHWYNTFPTIKRGFCPTCGATVAAIDADSDDIGGVKVISIGMFVNGNEPVVWRGPMLHRALQQFLVDVYWGDLDVLLVDLPPGTGDIAISLAQMLPTAELVVVTTPQQTAARIAERAGAAGAQTKQRVAGIVENMSWYMAPDGSRQALFGAGGGAMVSEQLTEILGVSCPLLGQIPFDPNVCATGDGGTPIVLTDPNSNAANAFRDIAGALAQRRRNIVGLRLAATPA